MRHGSSSDYRLPGTFCHYLHNGQWSSGGAWGAERTVGQPLAEAHKLRAIYDWIAAHP